MVQKFGNGGIRSHDNIMAYVDPYDGFTTGATIRETDGTITKAGMWNNTIVFAAGRPKPMVRALAWQQLYHGCCIGKQNCHPEIYNTHDNLLYGENVTCYSAPYGAQPECVMRLSEWQAINHSTHDPGSRWAKTPPAAHQLVDLGKRAILGRP